MSEGLHETVREVEEQIAQRLAAAEDARRLVEQARVDAAATREQACEAAEHEAAARAEQILSAADRDAHEVRRAGQERVERLVAQARSRRAADVETVLRTIVPTTAGG